MVKNLPAMQETPGFDPWVGKILWRREWQPTWRIPWTEEPARLLVHGVAKSWSQLSNTRRTLNGSWSSVLVSGNNRYSAKGPANSPLWLSTE